MPTTFDTDFEDDDIIEVIHVKQYAQPINDLEDALEDKQDVLTGTADVPGLDSALAGKANSSHTHAAADITSGSIPVVRGGTGAGTPGDARANLGAQAQDDALDEISTLSMVKGDIFVHDGTEIAKLSPGSNGQILSADSAETTGLKWAAPSGGAEELNDLDDVEITAPTAGQVLRYDGDDFVNADFAITDVDGLQAAIDAKQDELTGVSDVPGLDSALAGKANTSHTHAASDITSGTLAVAQGGTGANLSATGGSGQVLKQSTSGGAVTVGALAATDMPSAIDAAKIGSGAVSNTEFGYLDGVTSAVQTQINNKANSTHTHAASDITSGTLAVAQGGTGANLTATGGSGQVLKQSTSGGAVTVGALAATDMPSAIDAAKIGSGTVSNTEFGYLDGVTSAVQTQINNKANSTHTHAASDITSGTLPVARGGTGADLTASGGSGHVLKQSTSGGPVSVSALSAGDMPTGIDAVRIGTGSVSNTEFGYLDGVTSSIQTQLDSKLSGTSTLPISQGGTGATTAADARTNLGTNNAANITTGTLPIARGGTSATSAASARSALGAVGGSGASNLLAIWNGTSSLTTGNVSISGSYLQALNLRATSGSFDASGGDLVLTRVSSQKARFGTSQTFLYSVRNVAGGQLMYWNTSTGEVAYQFSRRSHKEDIENLDTTMEDLMKWKPVSFKWKEAFGGIKDIGLIAEEVASLSPLSAFYDQNWDYTDEKTGSYNLNEDGSPKKLDGAEVPAGVKYEKAWLPMLAAVQDFYRKHKQLEEKVAVLEAALGGKK